MPLCQFISGALPLPPTPPLLFREMEQELQMVGQLREERAEVRRLQTQVEELFTTRQALSHELGDLLGKVGHMTVT